MPNTVRVAVRLPLLALIATLTLGVTAADAAVTSSHVTAPTSPSFVQRNNNNTGDPAHQLTVSGTSTNDGTPGNVDLICTYDANTKSQAVASNVTVNSDGSFSDTVAPPSLEQACVLRAVPAATTPANLAPFTGPTVGLGDFGTSTVTTGPNSGHLYDFYQNAAQLSGDADYQSVGDGGLYDAYLGDPTTLVEGADMFYANNYLEHKNTDRSDIQVDGLPAYAAYAAEKLVTNSSSTFSGLPAVTVTASQDPATGDLTVHESELLVKCAPTPSTYPATTTSCTSFASTGVRFDRTIVQNQAGRQTHLTDTYTSVDGQAHAIDLRYGQDFQNANAGFRFPWVDGASYTTHAAADTIAAPPSAPVTLYANWNNTLTDGDQTSAQGAITFADRPSALTFLAKGDSGATHLFVSFTRNVPAGGSVTLRTAYSWAFTISDVQALAAIAEQSYQPPAATTGAARSLTTTGATVTGSVNPNGQATTYHFDYGISTGYGSSTATANLPAGTTAAGVSAVLSGLTPGTTYHYRVIAGNGSGTTAGTDATFTTATAPTTQLTVGRERVRGKTVSVALTCTGASGVKCSGVILETIRVRVRHGHHFKTVTKTVGRATYSLTVGQTRTIKVTLNATGRAALRHGRHGRLRVKVIVKLGKTTISTRAATLKAVKAKKHGLLVVASVR